MAIRYQVLLKPIQDGVVGDSVTDASGGVFKTINVGVAYQPMSVNMKAALQGFLDIPLTAAGVTTVQKSALIHYFAAIAAGTDTSSAETAMNAL